METLMGMCGLVCSACPAYQATQANDPAARERVAALWREMYHAPNLTADAINCDGCLSTTGRLFAGHCLTCEIRASGLKRGLTTCAACPDYACETLTGFFQMVPDARTRLDALRPASQEIRHGYPV